MGQSDPFDNAIAATGAATIAWMAAHNLHPKGSNVTAVHTAIACTHCTSTAGELAFIEAIPDAGVIITAASTFFHREPVWAHHPPSLSPLPPFRGVSFERTVGPLTLSSLDCHYALLIDTTIPSRNIR